jgi:hypothetical protein
MTMLVVGNDVQEQIIKNRQNQDTSLWDSAYDYERGIQSSIFHGVNDLFLAILTRWIGGSWRNCLLMFRR